MHKEFLQQRNFKYLSTDNLKNHPFIYKIDGVAIKDVEHWKTPKKGLAFFSTTTGK